MNNSHRSAKLADIASIRQGHPFRGAISAIADGPVRVIQLKNLSASGVHDPNDLLRTRLHPRKTPDWVQEGDVLLAARGVHPIAVLLCNPPADTVCSPHLYVIRVNDHERVMPAFLAWQLNQQRAQEYLRRQAAGSRQQSLRKAAVEVMHVHLPPLTYQQRIVSIARAAQLEQRSCEEMVAARHREVAQYAEHILNGFSG
ncbi:TPA: restriction endonuclease subunit S [Stenotrophomonas maltophilia]|nr:restriction endonuclease subunit S [Stenotrophomonas maltophilia]